LEEERASTGRFEKWKEAFTSKEPDYRDTVETGLSSVELAGGGAGIRELAWSWGRRDYR